MFMTSFGIIIDNSSTKKPILKGIKETHRKEGYRLKERYRYNNNPSIVPIGQELKNLPGMSTKGE